MFCLHGCGQCSRCWQCNRDCCWASGEIQEQHSLLLFVSIVWLFEFWVWWYSFWWWKCGYCLMIHCIDTRSTRLQKHVRAWLNQMKQTGQAVVWATLNRSWIAVSRKSIWLVTLNTWPVVFKCVRRAKLWHVSYYGFNPDMHTLPNQSETGLRNTSPGTQLVLITDNKVAK